MSQRVKLNIGGAHFETTVATLTRDQESMLAKMIEQPNEKKLIAEGKELFIDRDGTHFAYILNYLRDGDSLVLPPGNASIRPWLMQEANFYQLSSLAKFAQNNSAFKVGDLVQLHGDFGYRFFDLIAYGGAKRNCWVCHEEKTRTPMGFIQRRGEDPSYDIIFGKIREMHGTCAIVNFAYTNVFQAYTGIAYMGDDCVNHMHMPLMCLRLA